MSAVGYLGSFDLKQGVSIVVINPVEGDPDVRADVHLQSPGLLAPSTRVDEIDCPGGPQAINDSRTARATAHLVVAKARWAQEQGYDVALVNCMLDPGVREARAAVSIPVIGLSQATHAIAALLGGNVAVFDPEAIKVEEYGENIDRTYGLLLDAGRRKVHFQGADVLIPNCTYLGGLAGNLQKDLGVPVLANRDVALKVAELIASFGLRPEADWVSGKRSRTKMLLTRLYRVPLLGSLAYGIVQGAKAIRPSRN